LNVGHDSLHIATFVVAVASAVAAGFAVVARVRQNQIAASFPEERRETQPRPACAGVAVLYDYGAVRRRGVREVPGCNVDRAVSFAFGRRPPGLRRVFRETCGVRVIRRDANRFGFREAAIGDTVVFAFDAIFFQSIRLKAHDDAGEIPGPREVGRGEEARCDDTDGTCAHNRSRIDFARLRGQL
jgi:hypothetical protein